MNRNYIGLWWLLLTAFVFFGLLSACDSITVFGHEFKSAKIADALFSPASGDSAMVAQTAAASDSVAAHGTAEVRPDTTAQTILLIGDSMLEGISPRLAAYCAKSGHKLYTVIWYSSTSERWGSSDRLRDYMKRIRPTFVVVCLGANELFVSNIEEKRDKFVKNIIADIGTTPYLWIGPPNWKPDTGINRLISRNTAPGSFFLSDGMTFSRKKDGAHPTKESAALWVDSVVRWMPQHSNHPIRLDTPTEKYGNATRVYVHQPNEQ